jgi:hypothetical protein
MDAGDPRQGRIRRHQSRPSPHAAGEFDRHRRAVQVRRPGDEIEKKFNVTIIANVGDQESDLAGGHAERMFKIPNPFDFIP